MKKTTRVFTIDPGNTMAVSTSTELRASKSGVARFTNEKQFAALAAHWPSGRLIEIWNNLPGVRKMASLRIGRPVCAVSGRPSNNWSPTLAHTRPQTPTNE